MKRIVKKWMVRLGGAIQSSPVIHNGYVYCGCTDTRVYSVDVFSGNVAWDFATGGVIRGCSPLVHRERVHIGNHAGVVHSLDSKSGVPQWTYRTNGPIQASMCATSEGIVIGSGDFNAYLCKWDNGERVWHFATTGPVLADPVLISNDVCLISSDDYYIYAVDVHLGREIWRTLTQFWVRAAPRRCAEDLLVVSHTDVWRMTADGGAIIKWRFRTDNEIVGNPAVCGERCVFGNYDGTIFCIEVLHGHRVWVFQTGDMVVTAPVIRGKYVYVTSYDGNVYCIDVTNGREVWRFAAEDAIGTSCAHDERTGCIVFGCDDGCLYGLEEVV